MTEGEAKPQVEIVVVGATDSAHASPKSDDIPVVSTEVFADKAKQKQLKFTIDPAINEGSESGSSSVRELPIADLEKEPQFDHYRNALSIKRQIIPRRPSLKQLHGVEWDQDQESIPLPSQKVPIEAEKKKLGWIEGVLIRCVLNIIGVMLYLRISWVAAQAGLLLGSVVLLLSSAIVFLTALINASTGHGAAILLAGGTYFIISRSLGPDFGGSIGIIFAVANAVSAAVYLAGFADTILEIEGAWGPLITAGVFSSTLSSALASTVSAPKVLQAVARDRIFPYIGFFAKGSKKSDEPVRGYLLTFAITVGIIAIGDINQIAPLISNFFMASYALINYACFDASFAKSPGFRPAFKFYNMWLSLLGAFTCTVMMFFISWVNALITVIFIMLLYVYLTRRKPDVNWGDSTQANSFKNAVQNMLKLQTTQDHVKTYRPMILLLTGNPCKRKQMVNFVSNITRNQGMLICGQVLLAPLDDSTLQARQHFSQKIVWWLKKRHIRAFYYSYLANNLQEGVLALLQLCGMGKLSPNIMIMGFKNDWDTSDYAVIKEYFLLIHCGFDFNKGVGILRIPNSAKAPAEKETKAFMEIFNSERQQPNLLRTSADDRLDGRSSICTSQSVESFAVFAERLMPTDSERKRAKSTTERNNVFSVRTGQVVKRDIQDEKNKANADPRCHTASSSSSLSEASARSQFEIEVLDNEEKKKHAILSITKLRRKASMEKTSKVAVENFQKRIKKAVIDVWWLYDDGGLSILIPHLLSQEGYLENAKLRVFTIVKRSDVFDDEQSKLIILLNKLRIKFNKVNVFAEDRIQDNEETLRLFHELISKFKVPNKTVGQMEEPAASVLVDDVELATFRSTTERIMKARNLLLTHSKNANLIIVTIPVPRKKALSASLYLAWLELLSRDLPLTFLLRGNQEPVLTFYS